MKKNPDSKYQQRRARSKKMLPAEKMKPEILRAVDALTPPSCAECSSPEIAGYIYHTTFTASQAHSIGCMLAVYKEEGLVENRKKYRLALWKLTPKGRAYVKGLP